MNLLLNNPALSIATGKFNDLFDTECRTITINKEPLQIINQTNINTSPNPLFGYGDAAIPQTEITYQPISASFQAVVVYKQRISPGTSIAETEKTLDLLDYNYIKVKEDAHNFIEQGSKVESIVIDGRIFNLGKMRHCQYFYGLLFWYYLLIETL